MFPQNIPVVRGSEEAALPRQEILMPEEYAWRVRGHNVIRLESHSIYANVMKVFPKTFCRSPGRLNYGYALDIEGYEHEEKQSR